MATENERLEVLKLIESKQVTPEEGARLLAALGQGSRVPRVAREDTVTARANGRWFKLLVEEPGRQNVNLTLPLTVVPSILRVAARWIPEEHRDVLGAVAEALNSDFRGELLRVDEPGGQSVRIWIE